MSNQRRFEEPPMAIGEKKQVVVLELDTSYSMCEKDKIKKLVQAVNRLIEKGKADDLVSRNVELIIVVYNSHAEVFQPAAPMAKCMGIDLNAAGETNAEEAYFLSVKVATDRCKVLEKLGGTVYIPWIFHFTDGRAFMNGQTQDLTRVAQDVKRTVANNKVRFMTFGVDDADYETLEAVYGKDYVFSIEDYDFQGVFDWLFKTVRAITRTAPGEEIDVDAMPDTVLDAEDRKEKKKRKLKQLMNA